MIISANKGYDGNCLWKFTLPSDMRTEKYFRGLCLHAKDSENDAGAGLPFFIINSIHKAAVLAIIL